MDFVDLFKDQKLKDNKDEQIGDWKAYRESNQQGIPANTFYQRQKEYGDDRDAKGQQKGKYPGAVNHF